MYEMPPLSMAAAQGKLATMEKLVASKADMNFRTIVCGCLCMCECVVCTCIIFKLHVPVNFGNFLVIVIMLQCI